MTTVWQPAPEPFTLEAAQGVAARARVLGFEVVQIARTVPMVKARMSAQKMTDHGWLWTPATGRVNRFDWSTQREYFVSDFFPFWTALKLSLRYAKTEADCR